MLRSKAYEAGLKPKEFYEATLKEVLGVIDAYDKRTLQHFNLNTRILAWYSIAPHVEKGRMPSFDSFLNHNEQEDTNAIGEDLQKRADFIRAKYRELGYLK